MCHVVAVCATRYWANRVDEDFSSKFHLAPQKVPIVRLYWHLSVSFGNVGPQGKSKLIDFSLFSHSPFQVRSDRRPLLVPEPSSRIHTWSMLPVEEYSGCDLDPWFFLPLRATGHNHQVGILPPCFRFRQYQQLASGGLIMYDLQNLVLVLCQRGLVPAPDASRIDRLLEIIQFVLL